jgi:hypothetical protein
MNIKKRVIKSKIRLVPQLNIAMVLDGILNFLTVVSLCGTMYGRKEEINASAL